MNEQGIWIVYDLETNRLIQQLLTSNKFAFTFHPNLNFLKIHSQDSSKPKLEMGNEGGDIHNNIHPDAYSTESERECKQCGYRYIPKIDFGGCCSYDCQKLLSTDSVPEKEVQKGCGRKFKMFKDNQSYVHCGYVENILCPDCEKLNKSEVNSQRLKQATVGVGQEDENGRNAISNPLDINRSTRKPDSDTHSNNKELMDKDYSITTNKVGDRK